MAETFYEVISFGYTCPPAKTPQPLILYAIAVFSGVYAWQFFLILVELRGEVRKFSAD